MKLTKPIFLLFFILLITSATQAQDYFLKTKRLLIKPYQLQKNFWGILLESNTHVTIK